MKTFIKLTQTGNGNIEGYPIWIDPKGTLAIQECNSRTRISVGTDYFYVRESAKEIFELIGEYDLIRLCRGKEND